MKRKDNVTYNNTFYARKKVRAISRISRPVGLCVFFCPA